METKTDTLISHTFAPVTKPKTKTKPGNYKQLRKGSQMSAFEALKDKQQTLLVAPTGWGKSMVLIATIAYKLLLNPRLRCIIAVPQTVIANGFTRAQQILVPGHGILEWHVGKNNLCSKTAKNTVANVIQFLSHEPGELGALGSRVLVCTHATMAHVYKKLSARKELGLLNNCLLLFDEGHHILSARIAGSEKHIHNRLGRLVLHCIEHANRGLHVGLATATYFRGDRRHILPDTVLEEFTQERVEFDAYWKEVGPLKGFQLHVACGETFALIKDLLKSRRPTIIYLAKRNTRFATGDKAAEVKLVKEIAAEAGLHLLDLVTVEGRRQRQAILADPDAKVDVILALDTCKEGFDWPKAEHSIIVGERHSINEFIQMIGRILRKSDGKKVAKVFQLLPVAVPNTKSFTEDRNAISTLILSVMLLRNVLLPISIKKDGGTRTLDRLDPKLPDKIGMPLLRDFIAAVQGKTYEQSRKMIRLVLSNYAFDESEWETIWENLWLRCAYETKRIDGLQSELSFNLLKETDIGAGMLKLMSRLCGDMVFKDLREAIRRSQRSPEEWVFVAEDLAKNNGGVLPSSSWLAQNGFSGMVIAMLSRPGLFEHIPQDRKKKTREEWMSIAEDLAKQNGGVLPNRGWLEHNGFSGMVLVMRNHPELFDHIPQDNKAGKTTEEQVRIAEDLAKENGGVLPNSAWLRQHRHFGVTTAMQKHPKLFEHIPQDKKRKTAQEWVRIAEDLVRKHGRQALTVTWLRKHKLMALFQAMQKRPELFTHLTNAA